MEEPLLNTPRVPETTMLVPNVGRLALISILNTVVSFAAGAWWARAVYMTRELERTEKYPKPMRRTTYRPMTDGG
jgi:hypothetical protein